MDCIHHTPKRIMTPSFLSLILGGIFLTASPAFAGKITNLSDNPVTIEVKVAGGYEEEVIKPGRTYGVSADLDIRYQDQDFFIDDNVAYAIWPDGTLGPQRKLGRRRGG